MIVFTLLVAFVIVPIMGLGIDAATQYWVKARLSSAVDSAALAAARSLSVGTSVASQTSNAQAVGRQYFAANFPPGTLGTTVYGGVQVSDSVTINVTPGTNQMVVSATAQVYAPLYFMKMLHFSSGTIVATSQTIRRNANIVMVLDRSGSMNNASSSCSALVNAAEFFTNQFIDGRDQLTLITFSTGAAVNYGPSIYFKSGSQTINSVLSTLVCGGATSTAQAMTLAYNEILQINQPAALNVILLFTDGGANTIVSYFPTKTQADTRYNYYDQNTSLNTSTLVSDPASSCSPTDIMVGGFTDFSGSLNPTGLTGGVLSPNASALNQNVSTPPLISAPGCAFVGSGYYNGYNAYQARVDVAYIPTNDIYGNLTVGYKASNTFPSGPYTGQIRPDSPLGVRNAAANATDYRAQTIRSNTVYNVITYTIGLAGNENIPMDTDFLERIANDPRASNYNSSQPQGMFLLATDNASMQDAFNAVATQILRLSR